MRSRSGRKAGGWILFVGCGLLAALAGVRAILGAAAEGDPASAAVTPSTGEPGITETVAQIMAREARAHAAGLMPARPTKRPYRMDIPRRDDPAAPDVSQWPPVDPATSANGLAPEEPLAPQPLGFNFKAISLLSPNESQFIPPDSMGDVGPTQVLAAANGRIKVFSKSGVVGGLNADLDVFFTSVLGGSSTTDPNVRYDRLSGRWFVTGLSVDPPNRVLIAVSSGSTITDASSFSFFFFQHDLVNPPGDTGDFADYDSLGVDRLALYIGTNTFNAAGTIRLGATGFVVNKANLLGGTLTVAAFRGLNTAGASAGPYSPRGVDNDDPNATEGYFIGVDNAVFSRLVLRRISNPGGTPSISGNLNLTVPTTTFPILVPHLGMATSTRRLDALDDGLFAARIHVNKLTGVASLWTAHNIQVNTSGVGNNAGGRDGARWYEIRNMTTTPTLNQSGTLFDATATNPRFFWIPTVAMSGQGHMALGSSTAGTNFRADVAVAGRFSTDALGTIQPFTAATASSTAYNQQAVDGQRWGDYSQTVVDPADDMTLWTFQEYCDATNSWGVRAVQLVAPPPAAPASAAPSTICQGAPSTSVIITGTSASGSGFFDPGPDTGGPGFSNHLTAAVTGGVTINSATFNSPTQVTLNVSAAAAPAGTKDVIITNPDGQSAIGSGILTVVPQPAAPAAANDGPHCAGATLQLSATTVAGVTYSWTGPNGFVSSQQNPSIPNATAAASGTYSVTASVGGCASSPATTVATVTADGGTCNDGNACTQTDTCQAGACTGSNPVVCTASDSCHDAGTCNPGSGVCSNPPKPDGSTCNDADACTQTDTCQAGACTGSNPVVCTASDSCHDAGTCSPGSGVCSNPPKPDGSTCNDANACTQTDTCQAGACTGSNPVVCTASDSCHDAGTCSPGSGVCSNPPKPDGSSCEDGNACTQADTCQAGSCLGGSLRDADLDGRPDALCGGNDCNDTNPLVWFAPAEVTNMTLTTENPANPSWDDQGPFVGPETRYDLVSGPLATTSGVDFPASVCLQPAGGASFSDARPDPAAGSGFWYLARAQNSCGVGTYGSIQRDTTIPPCP